MTAIKGSNGAQPGGVPSEPLAVAEPKSSARAASNEKLDQKPSQPPRDVSKTSQYQALIQKQLVEFAETYKASGAYEKDHAYYAAKFPELGKPDGTPIGALLSDLKRPVLTKADLRPGDILISYEPDPSTAVDFRKNTIRMQKKDHNGLPDAYNQGDARNVHNAIWTHTPGNPKATVYWGPGEPNVVEGRAARDRKLLNPPQKPIDRVQPSTTRVAGLKNCKIFRPTDPNLGTWMAQVAMTMASGHVLYATKELSSGAKGHYALTPEAKKEVVAIAEDAFNPVPGWAQSPVNMHDKFKPGVNCMSLVVKVGQAAQLQIMRAKEVEKGNPPPSFEELTDKLTGLFATNSAHISPRSGEHFLIHGKGPDGKPLFEFVGKIEIKPEDEEYSEGTPPMDAAQLPPLPETHPHSIEYQKKLADFAKQKAKL